MSRPTLDPTELRVAGTLAEKALATPDQYPMTLRALTVACNQKTGRDPVTDFNERDVTGALERLMRRSLVGTSSGAGSRSVKYRHLLDRGLEVSPRELAVLALLMLRGPQTPGELRSRSARLADFDTVELVEEALWLLSDRERPYVTRLPRQPGQAADRYAHLLGGEVPQDEPTAEPAHPVSAEPSAFRDRPAPGLEARVAALESEVASQKAALEAFRAQFE